MVVLGAAVVLAVLDVRDAVVVVQGVEDAVVAADAEFVRVQPRVTNLRNGINRLASQYPLKNFPTGVLLLCPYI